MLFIGAMLILFKNLFENDQRELRKLNADLHETLVELEETRNEAVKANLAKSEFLSTMSHEIRTPLNAVIGMSYILLKENPRPDQMENLKVLKFSAENLLSLINDVLDYDKIEAGKLVMEDAGFELEEILNSVTSAFSLKAEEKGIGLVLEHKLDVLHYFKGDVTRLTQVLNNLVGNTEKFTDDGEVRVRIGIADSGDNKSKIKYEVIDTGIGIPDDVISKIFESFIQAHSGITKKYGGTGLGPAISKELIRLMGGALVVESKMGEGSNFSFELELEVSPVTVSFFRTESEENTTSLEGVKILPAEDNKINAMIANKFLNGWGATTDVAGDGSLGIEKWKEDSYDLILMDPRMPEMSGTEAASIIRSEGSEKSKIPILSLTASAMLSEQHEIFQAGMDEYISKPFNPAS